MIGRDQRSRGPRRHFPPTLPAAELAVSSYGEIADTRFRIRRRVHAGDPADLGSPLSYRVEVLAGDDGQDLDPAAAGLSPSRQGVLAALQAGGDLQTVKQLGDRLAETGRARYWSPAPTDDGDGGGAGTP